MLLSRSSPLSGILAITILGSVIGCGGGGATVTPSPDDNKTPQVLGIAPTGMVGTPGETVTFAVSATETPTTYEWRFTGGISPAVTTDAAPSIILPAEGSYTGRVTICAEGDCAEPFTFGFSVHAGQSELDPPLITTVVPNGSIGVSTQSVEFSAVATNSPTTWNWSFGGGAEPNTSTDATPDVVLRLPGFYTGSVTATNAGGDSLAFSFNYTVSLPSPAFAAGYKVDASKFTSNCKPSVTLLDGKPVIVYGNAEGAVQTLRVAIATNATPMSPSDWTIQQPIPTTSPMRNGMNTGVAAIGGKLHIAHLLYNTATEQLLSIEYARATVAAPSSPSDWGTHTVAPRSTDVWLDIQEVAGAPVIVTSDGSPATPVLYVADSATPSATGDWDLLLLPDDFTGVPDAAVIEGRLGLVSTGVDGVKYAESTDSDLLTAGWKVMAISPLDCGRAELINHDGKPVFTVGLVEPGLDMRLWIGQSSVAHPTSGSDWDLTLLDTRQGTGSTGLSLASINGRLAVIYLHATSSSITLNVARALVGQPTLASDWQIVPVLNTAEGYNSVGDCLLPTPSGLGLVYSSTGKYNLTWTQQTGIW